MVADGGCLRQVFKSTGREIGCVLLLFWFSCLVHLIPCGNNEIQIRVLRNGNVQGGVPANPSLRAAVLAAPESAASFPSPWGCPLEAPI